MMEQNARRVGRQAPVSFPFYLPHQFFFTFALVTAFAWPPSFPLPSGLCVRLASFFLPCSFPPAFLYCFPLPPFSLSLLVIASAFALSLPSCFSFFFSFSVSVSVRCSFAFSFFLALFLFFFLSCSFSLFSFLSILSPFCFPSCWLLCPPCVPSCLSCPLLVGYCVCFVCLAGFRSCFPPSWFLASLSLSLYLSLSLSLSLFLSSLLRFCFPLSLSLSLSLSLPCVRFVFLLVSRLVSLVVTLLVFLLVSLAPPLFVTFLLLGYCAPPRPWRLCFLPFWSISWGWSLSSFKAGCYLYVFFVCHASLSLLAICLPSSYLPLSWFSFVRAAVLCPVTRSRPKLVSWEGVHRNLRQLSRRRKPISGSDLLTVATPLPRPASPLMSPGPNPKESWTCQCLFHVFGNKLWWYPQQQ